MMCENIAFTSLFVSCGRIFRSKRQLCSASQRYGTPQQTQHTYVECVQRAPSRTEVSRVVIPLREPELRANGDSLHSTSGQVAAVAAFLALETAGVFEIATRTNSIADAAAVVAAVVAAYLFADFGTGVYHWALDNYGSKDTPVFGYQIEAFQGHHSAPWTITKRSFVNNAYRLAIACSPVQCLFLLAPFAVPFVAFGTVALGFIAMSQEIHRQAHLTRAAPWVRALQDCGLLVSKRMHGRHHTEPYDGNYCIVSGIWNEPLDNSRLFRWMEKVVYNISGHEPIAWALDPQLKQEALND